MSTFELDLAFTAEEIATGLERLFARRGLPWSRTAGFGHRYEFTTELASGTCAVVIIGPVPPERQPYASFFPRALLQAHAGDAVGLEALRHEIILAFLRAMG